jgi:hypothetical protein
VVIKISTPKEATMHRKKRRILKSLVLGFAVAAIAAPAALAEPRGPGNDPIISAAGPDDRAFYRGTSNTEPGSYFSPAIRGEQVKSITERPSFGPVSQPTVSSSTDDGFQWADAGLGAASTLALVLLMGAAGLLIRHQRRRLVAF